MKTDRFDVASRLDGDVAVVYPRGYLNNLSGEMLVSECGKHIDNGIKKIVLNFGETGVINSIGISLLLQVIEDLRAIEGTVCFTNMSRFQVGTFEMLGLIKYMLVFQAESDALRHLSSTA